MSLKPNSPTETYNQISGLLEEMKAAAKFDTRLSLLEQDRENYVKETDIHKMISYKINKYDEEQVKKEKNGIQWGAIIQQLVIGAVSCLITYFLINGAKG
jgi:hypothetical protein